MARCKISWAIYTKCTCLSTCISGKASDGKANITVYNDLTVPYRNNTNFNSFHASNLRWGMPFLQHLQVFSRKNCSLGLNGCAISHQFACTVHKWTIDGHIQYVSKHQESRAPRGAGRDA